MAYTRIHAVKATVHKSIEYICNPEKTEGNLLLHSFACTEKTAEYDFRMALSKTKSADKNLAYHLIQSFAPGEITGEEAHRIGIDLADRLLKGNYSYVVATHTDKGHVHSHIIFCAADNTDHKKFNSCRKSYRLIRQISDDLCREHGLSVIEPREKGGKSYAEWKALREGKSWKADLIRCIDEAVMSSKSYEEFLEKMKEAYEVEHAGLDDKEHRFLSFRAPGYKRFIVSSYRNFGRGYSKEEIVQRIRENEKRKDSRKEELLSGYRPKVLVEEAKSRKKLIDISEEKFQNSPGLKRWAEMQNLQTVTGSYAGARNTAELKEMIDAKREEEKRAKSELTSVERELKELKEIRYHLNQYKENYPFRKRYKESKDPDRYFRMHETELILFDGAKQKLQKMGILPKASELSQVEKDIAELEAKREELRKKYKAASKERGELEQNLKNVEQFLGIDSRERDREKDPGQNHKKEQGRNAGKKSR